MAQQLPRAAAVAVNTFDGIDPLIDANLSAKLPNPLSIGPLHFLAPRPAVPDHYHCLSWLDRHVAATVVYVSFGTVASAPPSELAELADGLEAGGVPFLWSLKEAARELLPPGFLDRTKERGMVVSWAPQVEVLGHVAVGAFVTHAGWLSVLEGITSGVVMVCRPFFGDHMMVARAVSHVLGVGMAFEGGAVTKEGLMNALEVVLKGEEGKRMRKRVGELKAVAVQAFEPGGCSKENFYKLLKIITTKKLQ
ncbi:Anthocyanidin 3-O-glucosyltransferase 7 [Cocos nucifera]|nr:Anthocyanidin 3-O-glucosyltransferase 7 [Cocos nucifera]